MSGNSLARIVGTAIGYYFGGPFGGAIGGLIGGALVPEKLPDRVGQRLTDLRPQTSEYGRPIPIVKGSVGIAGNVIWAAPLFEFAVTTEEGGKGSPTQSSTNFTYYAYFAVAICEGECDVGRIWAGPELRLIYDGNGFVEGGDGGFGAVRVYRGTEDQLPDPLLEFYLGVGNVPAYRGTCYVVLQNFPVINDGNRIPFLTVEVGVANGVVSREPIYLGESAPIDSPFIPQYAAIDYQGLIWSHTQAFLDDTLQIRVNSDVTRTQVKSITIDTTDFTTTGLVSYPVGHQMWLVGEQFGSFADIIFVYDCDSLTLIDTIIGDYHGTGNLEQAFFNPDTGVVMGIRYGGMVAVNIADPLTSGLDFYLGETPGELGVMWCRAVLITNTYYAVVFYGSHQGVIFRRLDNNQFYGRVNTTLDPASNSAVFYDSARNRIILAGNGSTFEIIDIATLTSSTHTITAAAPPNLDDDPAPAVSVKAGAYYNGRYIFGADGGLTTKSTLFVIDGDTYAPLFTYTYEYRDPAKNQMLADPLVRPLGSKPYLFSFDETSVKRLYLGGIGMGGQSLSSIVTDLSLRAGLTEDQIDVSELTDTVDGYVISGQTEVRSAIDPLRTAYYFDPVESGDLIKFVKRGGTVIREISDDDLCATKSGSGEGGEPLAVARQMENELPQTLSVTHMLAATKYRQAAKDAERLIGSSGQRVTIDLPLVLTDTKAQEVAEVNLHTRWAERLKYNFNLGRKHAELEPTDIISVKGHTMLITSVKDSPNGVREFQAVADDSHYYTPAVVITETPPIDEEIFVPGATVLELM